MVSTKKYNGALTAEQFLFYEIRIVAKFFLEGKTLEEIIAVIQEENLFQYPTEREVSRLTRACYKRLLALDNKTLVYELAHAPTDVAKQINLYAMMRYNDLVKEFMINVIGEKYRQHDFTFTRKDINSFFLRLEEQNDTVASWSDKTIGKLKQVLVKSMIETEILDSYKSTQLNPLFISSELENGIRENLDTMALPAFNCFK